MKGQQSRIGNSITDGAYASMMRAIQRDEAPSYFFLHYEIMSGRRSRGDEALIEKGNQSLLTSSPTGEGWIVRNLLLVPHFAFPPSAIVKRPPLSATARRAGWVGCNFALNRIPVDARIPIVITHSDRRRRGDESLTKRENQSLLTSAPTIITPPDEVRQKFKNIKPLKDLSVTQRGWTLDVLNIVRRIKKLQFTNEDIYAFERELSQLHPDNRHIRDKIRQQLQVLRDTGFLVQPERGVWRVT